MEEDVMPGHCAFPHSISRLLKTIKIEFDTEIEGKDFSDEAMSDISVQLNKILEMMSVSEEMRLACKQIFFNQGIINTIGSRLTGGPDLVCVFGSCIEGSTIGAMAPDVDCVKVFKTRVINNTSEGRNESASHLIIQDTWTFPGYVKLQKVSFGNALRKTDKNDDPSLIPDKCGRLCAKGFFVFYRKGLRFSDLEGDFEKACKRHFGNYSKQGPASSFRQCNIKWDVVYAYQSHNILNIIPQWICRKRLYQWPSTDLLNRSSLLPTLLVRTGHPWSEENEIEWRISFSFFERELMFSLNPTQHKCYVTLKMIKNGILNQALPEKYITSYHLKTCVFWAVENTPEEMWRPEQLLRCVSICLWFLLYFVLRKNCLNYFLPSANLFQRAAFLRVQSSLLNVIINSIQNSFLSVTNSIKGLVDVICSESTSDTELPKFEEDVTIWLIKQGVNLQVRLMAKVDEVCESMETRIRCWENMYLELKRMQIPSTLLGSDDDSAIDIVKRIISLQINLRLTYCYAVQAIATPDESERLHLIGLTRDCACDLFNARLTYLTLLFKLNRLSECKEILRDLDDLYDEDSETETFYCPCRHLLYCDSLDHYLKEDIESTFKNQTTCMVFMPAEKKIVLEPLDLELNLPINYKDNNVEPGYYRLEFNRQWASVDGLVYFYFIRYLVYSGLNDVTMKINSIMYICYAATCGQVVFHEAVAYNLVGWIFSREGKLEWALNWWRKSLKRHPRNNAVNRYCVDFFSKCVGLGKDFKPLSQSTQRSIHHDVVLYHGAQPLVPNPVPTLTRPSDE